MSKRVPAEIGCPQCGTSFKVDLYRSLWIEDPANRALVAEDRLNRVTCPSCKTSTRLEFPVLCTNVKRGLAIWYEPYPDPQVDKDVLLYKKNFGPTSFYARAPRIREWANFKTKLLELEALTDPTKPRPQVSGELADAMAGFARSLSTPTHRRYPRFLTHLQNKKTRLWYSLVPITLLITLSLIDDGPAALLRHFGEVLAATLALTSISFVVLTAIHLTIVEFKPWRQRSKVFRAYCFGTVCWLVLTSFMVLLFDPFDYGDLNYWDDDDVLHFLSVSTLSPALVGAALYIYERFVK